MATDLYRVRRVRSDESRDPGVSLIEILVAIVLLGSVSVAVLAGLRTTIIGSATERDHARAHQWLQSATEVLVNDIPWADCDPANSALSASALRGSYELDLQADASIVPKGWGTHQLIVPVVVEFAGASGAYGSVCLDTEDRQRVTIQVEDPDGIIIETVEVVKIP